MASRSRASVSTFFQSISSTGGDFTARLEGVTGSGGNAGVGGLSSSSAHLKNLHRFSSSLPKGQV